MTVYHDGKLCPISIKQTNAGLFYFLLNLTANYAPLEIVTVTMTALARSSHNSSVKISYRLWQAGKCRSLVIYDTDTTLLNKR